MQPNALPLDIDDVVRKVAAVLFPYVGPGGARDPIPDPPISESSPSEEEEEVEDDPPLGGGRRSRVSRPHTISPTPDDQVPQHLEGFMPRTFVKMCV